MNTSLDLDRTTEDRPHVKVAIPLDGDGPSRETLWAEVLPSGLMRLVNVPCFDDRFHFHDIVRVDDSDPDDFPVVLDVVVPNTHATYHLEIAPHEAEDDALHKAHAREARDRLHAAPLGLHVEVGFGYAHVDVPPLDDVAALYELFNQLLADGLVSDPDDLAGAHG